MKTWTRLSLFVVLLALVGAAAFYVCDRFVRPPAQGPVDYHYWLHRQLNITAGQDEKLEPIEEKFAARRDELVAIIREANRELADALVTDKATLDA